MEAIAIVFVAIWALYNGVYVVMDLMDLLNDRADRRQHAVQGSDRETA